MSCELFIGNLNPEVRIRDLENVYGRYGKILRCDLKKNFGFIQYSDRRDAEQAMAKENNRKLLGSVMTVEWAKGSVGDKPRGGGGRGQRYRSPPRGGRDRSPYGGGRNRSPPRSFGGGFDREDRFGGGGFGGRRSGRGRDYDNPQRGPQRDRARGGDRFSGDGYGAPARGGPPSDRGDRRPPPRDNRSYDRPRGGDRGGNRRDSFSERRSFGGGPRRF